MRPEEIRRQQPDLPYATCLRPLRRVLERASGRWTPVLLIQLALLATTSCWDDLAVSPENGFVLTLEAVAWPDTILVGEAPAFLVRGLDGSAREVAGLALKFTSSDTTILALPASPGSDSMRLEARRPGTVRVKARIDQRPFVPAEVEGSVTVALAGLRTELAEGDTTTLTALGDTVVLRASGLDASGALVHDAGIVWGVDEGAPVELVPFMGGDSALVIARAPGVTALRLTHPTCRGECEAEVPVRVRLVTTTLKVTSSADTLTALGDTVRITVAELDRNGSPVKELAGSDLNWSSLESAVIELLAPGIGVSRGNGRARIVAARGGVADTVFVHVEQKAARLAFISAPDSAEGQVTFTPAVQVEVQDRLGSPMPPDWAGAVTISLANNPGNTTLSGTLTVPVASARATFGDLSLAHPGDGYALRATAAELDAAESEPFSVRLTFATVSAGGNHSCGVTTAGKAYCWGDGEEGQLGYGGTARRYIPEPVAGGLTFATLSAGYIHSCGVTTAGKAYCWGDGGTGKLGYGGTAGRLIPEPVAGGLTFATLSAGQSHSCGVTTTGEAYCWGQGGRGRLGDGWGAGSSVPVPVFGTKR